MDELGIISAAEAEQRADHALRLAGSQDDAAVRADVMKAIRVSSLRGRKHVVYGIRDYTSVRAWLGSLGYNVVDGLSSSVDEVDRYNWQGSNVVCTIEWSGVENG